MKTATEQVKTSLQDLWSILLTPACLLFIVAFLGLSVLLHRLGLNDETRRGQFRFRKAARPIGAKDVKKLKYLGLSQEQIKHVEETGQFPLE